MARYIVAAADEIPPGGRKIVEVAGRQIGIFNLGGEFFALRNRCPHMGGPLCEGLLWGALESPRPGEFSYSRPGEILACVWHGWEYDIRTGQSWCEPARLRVRAYPVSVEPGEALVEEAAPVVTEVDPAAPMPGMVKGPYRAETYPVAVDNQYVVVELEA
jgi:3-phenylpropionate/trans-cinnamate dioxygenase ferredoxin subunit